MDLISVYYENDNIINKLSIGLSKIINEDTVIICIGTDRTIFDSLAPLIGIMLKENEFNLPVYGTIEEPIHAKNIDKRLEEIKSKHPNSNIIGIDACLGDKENIGNIILRDIPIKPGIGMGKNLQPVGNYSIIGITDKSDSNFSLFNHNGVRLSLVYNMAKTIVKSIIKAEEIHINEQEQEIAVANF